MVRKKVALILGLLLAFSLLLSACGGGGGANSPEAAVSGFIDAIKKGDMKKAEGYLVNGDAVQGMGTLLQSDSDRIKESAAAASYEIVSTAMFEEATETEEGSEDYGGALVTVTINNKDMNLVSEKLFQALLAESANFASMSEKEVKKFWDSAMESAISQTSETVSREAEFAVVNDGGDWKIKSDASFFEAMFGTGAFLDI